MLQRSKVGAVIVRQVACTPSKRSLRCSSRLLYYSGSWGTWARTGVPLTLISNPLYRPTATAGPVLLSTSTTQPRDLTYQMEPKTWRPPPPCQVGDPESAVDTPALILDLDAAETNLATLPEMLKNWPGVVARVHIKAHKTPALAEIQVKRHHDSKKEEAIRPAAGWIG